MARPDGDQNVLGSDSLRTRHHWWLAVGLVLLVLAAGGVTWVAVTHGKYRATAVLVVEMQPASVLTGQVGPMDRDRFEIFKNTQRERVVQRFVLLAALRKPNVAKLPEVQEAQRAGDVVDWLKRHLSVRFPGNAEIMEVSFRSYNPKAAVTLVNAIVDAYLAEVVGAERDQKQRRYNQLVTACAAKDEEIRKTRQELKSLSQLNGTSTDSETMSQKEKLLLDDYAVYHQELAKTQFEVADLESRLAEQHALLASAGAIDADDPEVDALLQKDRVAHEIVIQLELKKKQTPAETGEIKVLEDQLGKRRGELVAVVRKRKQASVQAEIRRLTSLLNVKRRQFDVLAKQVGKLKEEVDNLGRSTVDVDMLRSNLKLLEAVYAEINSVRERLKVELDAAPCITLAERAEEPEN